MRRTCVCGLAAGLAAFLPAGAAGAVTKGQIAAGRGVAGITLGMTRGQVVRVLGRPAYQNRNGYMQFGTTTSPLFDVYLDVHTSPWRVRVIGVSGRGFCFVGGPCMFRAGGVASLRRRFGARLRIAKLETGERVYRIAGTSYRGCGTSTDITPSRFRPGGRLIMAFVGFSRGIAC